MTTAEAGRRGGSKVRDNLRPPVLAEIGRKGDRRVKELIAAGKAPLDKNG